MAVAASSAFPPVLSPAKLELNPAQFSPASGEPYHVAPYTSEVYLSDGGVYDNLGLETAWKRYETILVSDAGAARWPRIRILAATGRRMPCACSNMIDNQVRALRKRQLVASYRAGYARDRTGASARTSATTAPRRGCRVRPSAPPSWPRVATRLADMPDEIQERLINWGYAICDIALRRWVDPNLPAATRFPYARGV